MRHMDFENRQEQFCEQAQLQVVFEWNWKYIASGMNPEKYKKLGMRKCSGIGQGACPVRQSGRNSDFSKCEINSEIARSSH